MAKKNWDGTAGFLWYDYATDNFGAMPLHSAGRENGKAYLTQVVLPASLLLHSELLRVFDYFLRGAGFIADCLQPPDAPTDDVQRFAPNDVTAYSPAGSVPLGSPQLGGWTVADEENPRADSFPRPVSEPAPAPVGGDAADPNPL